VRRPGWEPNIDGGHKPSVKAPDPFDVDEDDIRFVESLSDSEVRRRLTQRGLSEFMVETLVADRTTNGGRWRIIQELRR
jgi:hypothetical protein